MRTLLVGLLLAGLALPAVAAGAQGPVPAYQPPAVGSFDTTGTVLRVVLGLLGVLALVLGSQRMLWRLGAQGGQGYLRVREARRLGANHALYVVEADGRRLLLGTGLAVVADLGAADEPPSSPGFASHLRAMTERVNRLGEKPQ